MRKIGLTGTIGSGKSEAASVLSKLGAVVIEADALGHESYRKGAPAYRELVAEFGQQIVGAEGELDRKALGKIVFADPARRRRLEAIVWPRIREAISDRLERAQKAGTTAAVVDAAVLIEAGWDGLVDEVWAVEAPEAQVMERLRRRNGWSEEEARARTRAQLSNTARRARATLVIVNDGGHEEFERRVRAAWEAPDSSGERG
jgi:dephospho-CoA kinase